MEYRKFKADYLFTGTRMLHGDYVLITDITGKFIDILEQNDAGDEVEILNGILSPGFINSHCHLELSHLKNKIPQDTGLTDFVVKVVTGRNCADDEIVSAMIEAEANMVQEGIIAVGDICNNSLTLTQKEKQNLHYYNLIEVSGWHPEVAGERFEKSKLYYDQFIKKGFLSSMVPHAPYSMSGILWGKITPFFSGKVVSIHNQETKYEDQFFLEGSRTFEKMYKMMGIDNSFYAPSKQRSLQTYFSHLATAASVILVHNTFTKPQDVEYINENKPPHQSVSFCLCSNANLYIENTLPPVEMLIQKNCNIVIGTDSLASNSQLSIMEELKTIWANFPQIAPATLLKWATINGAKALMMDHLLGSFEKGKKPGVVLIANTDGEKFTKDSAARKII